MQLHSIKAFFQKYTAVKFKRVEASGLITQRIMSNTRNETATLSGLRQRSNGMGETTRAAQAMRQVCDDTTLRTSIRRVEKARQD